MMEKTGVVYSKDVAENVIIKDFAVIYANAILKENVIIGEHSVIGRTPTSNSLMEKELSDKGKTLLHEKVVICSNVVVYNNVSIGADSLVGDNSSVFYDVTIGEKTLISRSVTINSDTVIGNNTRIMDNTHITGKAVIGNHVFISVGVMTANDNGFGALGFGSHIKGPVIEDYVSVGAGAVILPGVVLGKGCIVAAGSVVKDDVPEDVIVAGNPAVVVRKVPRVMKRY
jgi:acetyltransferase-like isoleucine patch superfamily enzyme